MLSPRRLLSFLSLWLLLSCAIFAADPVAPKIEPASLDALLTESKRIEANEPQRAVSVAREALALALTKENQLSELRARIRLAESLRLSSAYAEARKVIDAGLALPERDGEKLERAQLVYNSGQIFWNHGNYPLAERAYLQAQAAAESLDNKVLLARVLNSRGIVARHQRDFKQAKAHFQTALNLTEATQEIALKLQIQNNFGVLLLDLEEFEKARVLFNANLAAHTASNNRRSIANALVNLALIETSTRNYAVALDYNLRALAVRKEIGVPRHIASAQIAVASALTKLGRADEALTYLQAALPSVEKFNSHEFSGNLYAAFSDAHAARADYREALDFQKKAQKENEIVSGENTATAVAELRESFDAEKRERELTQLRSDQARSDAELALKEADLQRAKWQRYSLAGLLLFGSVTVSAIIGRQRARARAERLILEETQLARDAAEQANQLKTRLLDLASHDLKAPLVGVMMTADILIEESASQAKVVEPARAIRSETERMFKLVQELLDSSALETNQIPITRIPMDLCALVKDILPSFNARVTRKQQHIEFTASGSSFWINGDPFRLRQVVENLVDNALKFSPSGETVHVSVKSHADSVQVVVRDTGPGLSETDRKNLFQRFARLSATPTAGESSNGLGLSLAKDLVSLHEGKIWAEPISAGGAIFVAEFTAIQGQIRGITR